MLHNNKMTLINNGARGHLRPWCASEGGQRAEAASWSSSCWSSGRRTGTTNCDSNNFKEKNNNNKQKGEKKLSLLLAGGKCDKRSRKLIRALKKMSLLFVAILLASCSSGRSVVVDCQPAQQQEQQQQHNHYNHHLHNHHNSHSHLHQQHPTSNDSATTAPIISHTGPIIIDHIDPSAAASAPPQSATHPTSTSTSTPSNSNTQNLKLANYLQPASLFVAQNKSINFTHLALDETTGTIYLGATNWLFQLAGQNLWLEQALRTGPSSLEFGGSNARDCSPTDCLHASQLQPVHDFEQVPAWHAHPALDLRESAAAAAAAASSNPLGGGRGGGGSATRPASGATMHTTMLPNSSAAAPLATPRRPQQVTPPTAIGTPSGGNSSSSQQQQQSMAQTTNNYNKILAIDYDSRQLLVCGSLNQGACRRHQLGKLATNFSDLIPVPVVPNDEHSSSVALISGGGSSSRANGGAGQPTRADARPPVLYVAATNSRLGPYREMVPAISARYLDMPSYSQRAMQIIERSFTDSARVDISYELRDYYLVNYVHTFQYNDFIYFATIQRKSPLRQLEELGSITRLARLCLSDLSFQSYVEMTLECSSSSSPPPPSSAGTNYNLLQDAHLIQPQAASPQLMQQLGLSKPGAILVGAFAQSKDHTTRQSSRSAVCLFAMESIEQRFNENIDLCYNGTTRARNMNYIAGSVNDCLKAGRAQLANYCNEPIKLNGSLALTSAPVIQFEDELLTSISATLANTAQLGATGSNQQQQQQTKRSHQVLVAGTSEGKVKKIALISGATNGYSNQRASRIIGHEFDSIQVDEWRREPILADMLLVPVANPQLASLATTAAAPTISHQHQFARHQFVVAATAHKLVKLPINSCQRSAANMLTPQSNLQQVKQQASRLLFVAQPVNATATPLAGQLQLADECQACAQLRDPFCGWCEQTGACSSRDECQLASWAPNGSPAGGSSSWLPFDSIKCAHYRPIVPEFVALEADQHQQQIEINLRLAQPTGWPTTTSSAGQYLQLAAHLSRAQFVCHFDFGGSASGAAVTKASRARLNPSAGTLAVGCPLPALGQRPALAGPSDHLRAKLGVRLLATSNTPPPPPNELANEHQTDSPLAQLEQMLAASGANLAMDPSAAMQQAPGGNNNQLKSPTRQPPNNNNNKSPGYLFERELTFYECAAHSTCAECLRAGAQGRLWSCSWCPMSGRCSFNASHPDFGCAASAISSTTPQSIGAQLSGGGATGTPAAGASHLIRGSHLASSLDRAQLDLLGVSINQLAECPSVAPTGGGAGRTNPITRPIGSPPTSGSDSANEQQQQLAQIPGTRSPPLPPTQQTTTTAISQQQQGATEILVAHESRRSIQVQLKQPIGSWMQLQPSKRVAKLECLLELEGAKARLSARLSSQDAQLVICQDTQFGYQLERATQRAQMHVILNENQVIETQEVTIYKCHLFGISPPALASSVGAPPGAAGQQQSSAAWRHNNPLLQVPIAHHSLAQADCSMCANAARKYQCAWCSNRCQPAEQCAELPASSCPPPRIDSIHPNSGPLEGGTLLTIEGSNLGSNEREIQDKISVAGEPCHLLMYSVSTRIICKTGPSLAGPQAATVFVGNRAGVTSAHEKFHYKAVHLTDVNPRIGPVSGGTRLYLSGSNLNIGSRVQIFLDEIPCLLDSQHEVTSNQITCVTSPNPQAAQSMRINRLTLMIDNSTHYLPYPFTYHPDPIITSIEPAESFVSGGRLILVSGHHLSSPQTIKLLVYHEQHDKQAQILNGTNCLSQNDTLITCLTPALSRDLITGLLPPAVDGVDDVISSSSSSSQDGGAPTSTLSQLLSYESGYGGLKLKMMLIMDDVKSTRNLDEYYHHLPQYLSYYEDPNLFRLSPNQMIDYNTDEPLVIQGENLKMKQLDQDMLIVIGTDVCVLKSVQAQQVVCEPPQQIKPVYDDMGRLLDRPILPIVGLIGSNLRYQIGHMRYHSRQYRSEQQQQLSSSSSSTGSTNDGPLIRSSNGLISASPFQPDQANQAHQWSPSSASFIGSLLQPQMPPLAASGNADADGERSSNIWLLIIISCLGFLVAFSITFVFALARFRQSKSEREYKRIQLQMGSLDIQQFGNNNTSNQSTFPPLFDKIHLSSGGTLITNPNNNNNQQQQMRNYATTIQQQQQQPSIRTRAMDYVGGALFKRQPFYQFGNQPHQMNAAFSSPSPLTVISSLIASGSSQMNSNSSSSSTTTPISQQQQHIVRLASDGQTVISSMSPHLRQHQQQQQPAYYAIGENGNSQASSASGSSSSSSCTSSQSSPNSSGRGDRQPNQFTIGHQQQQQQHQLNTTSNNNKLNLLTIGQQQQQQRQAGGKTSRDFNWTQEAPSTIVPYAVIEACNLTLEGKKAIREYV